MTHVTLDQISAALRAARVRTGNLSLAVVIDADAQAFMITVTDEDGVQRLLAKVPEIELLGVLAVIGVKP